VWRRARGRGQARVSQLTPVVIRLVFYDHLRSQDGTAAGFCAWKKAPAHAGLEQVRVHDLRHTFGQRLRAAVVSLEDRKALLGHKSGDVTTHYSAPEHAKTIEYVERLCQERPNSVLRLATPAKVPQKVPQNAKVFRGLLTA